MKIRAFTALTRLEQSLFGLPMILSAILLSRNQFKMELLWIFSAFFAARISGMAFNQLIDRNFDARNFRTGGRPVVKGMVTVKEATFVAWGSLTLFLGICLFLGKTCFFLGCIAAFLIWVYSFIKRFHAVCHFVLGTIHFLAPLMTWVAIERVITLAPVLLGCVAFFSITAGDILYALQDREFDVRERLHSLPSRLGAKKSIAISYLIYVLCIASMIALGIVINSSGLYYIAPLLSVFGLYFCRHRQSLLFSRNVVISCSLFIFLLVDGLWRG